MSDPRLRLQAAIGYRFSDARLLLQALTHRSVGTHNNERLEFLGDAVLNAAVSAELFARHGGYEEGDLTRMRASLVNQEALAALALEIGLGEHLQLGPGELKSGGQRRASILADALEALIGAIYLDGGFDATRIVILQLFAARLQTPASPETLKDPKTQLQEWLQARNLRLPVYAVEVVTGEAHRQLFRVSCEVQALGVRAEGEAGSRRSAEQEAARHALGLLQHA